MIVKRYPGGLLTHSLIIKWSVVYRLECSRSAVASAAEAAAEAVQTARLKLVRTKSCDGLLINCIFATNVSTNIKIQIQLGISNTFAHAQGMWLNIIPHSIWNVIEYYSALNLLFLELISPVHAGQTTLNDTKHKQNCQTHDQVNMPLKLVIYKFSKYLVEI